MKIAVSQLRRIIKEEVSKARLGTRAKRSRRAHGRPFRSLRESVGNTDILSFAEDWMEMNPMPQGPESDDPYGRLRWGDRYMESMYQAVCEHFGQDCDWPDQDFYNQYEIAVRSLAGG